MNDCPLVITSYYNKRKERTDYKFKYNGKILFYTFIKPSTKRFPKFIYQLISHPHSKQISYLLLKHMDNLNYLPSL